MKGIFLIAIPRAILRSIWKAVVLVAVLKRTGIADDFRFAPEMSCSVGYFVAWGRKNIERRRLE